MTTISGITTLGLACGYDGRAVLTGVDITLPRGGVSCILGRSGCGKSTLLRTLLLLEKPLAGDVRFDGESILGRDPAALEDLRRQIGVLFQGSALFNSMTLLENTAFPIVERTGTPGELADELALLKLDLVGLARHAHYLPAAVSGGMRKRCGIARALALDPAWLFLDEPGAGLDPVTAAGLDALILEIRDVLGTTVVVVTHELGSIRAIADHVVMIDHGRVVAEGSRAAVEASPDDAVRAFFQRRPPERRNGGGGGLAGLILPDAGAPGILPSWRT